MLEDIGDLCIPVFAWPLGLDDSSNWTRSYTSNCMELDVEVSNLDGSGIVGTGTDDALINSMDRYKSVNWRNVLYSSGSKQWLAMFGDRDRTDR